MRAVLVAPLLLSALALPAVAEAPKPFPKLGFVRPPAPAKVAAAKARVPAITTISHVIYMNNCLPNGCDLTFGADDSRTNRSSLSDGVSHMSPWNHGAAAWDALVQCVRETYSPFDVTIVTDDPGNVPHSEIIVAGLPGELGQGLEGAGGVSPTLGCGATEDNVITFMFAGLGYDLNYLCGGVAQETCHAWGLDHELDKDDPLTYLELGTRKSFQDSNPQCGESLSDPRSCYCGGATQNTYQYLMDNFGPANLLPASMEIVTPKANAWVMPGFPVRVVITDQLSITNASMTVDGVASGAVENGPVVFNAPAVLAPGAHTVEVRAEDYAKRILTATTTVNVIGSCAAGEACAAGTLCITGLCVPDATYEGGLGHACTTNDECVTQQCASDGTNSYCTGACTEGACPSGYDCLDNNVCWPNGSDGGGCSAAGGDGAMVMLVGLGIAVTLRRRKR